MHHRIAGPDSGAIRLLGIDPQADKARIHEITGVQLQSGAFPAKLRVGEIIDMYRSFYRHPAETGELAEVLGLAGKRHAYYRSLSAASSSGCPWCWHSSDRPGSRSWTR